MKHFMSLDQIVLYLAAPLIALLLVLSFIALKLAHKDFLRLTIKGLGVRICVESTTKPDYSEYTIEKENR